MNSGRVKRLTEEILHLERELSKELGYATALGMRRGYQRWVDSVGAKAAGFATVKAWKHAKEKTK